MGELLGLLAEAAVNLVVWDDRLRHELRERHPWMFAIAGVALWTALGLLAVFLFVALNAGD
ncbi:hypothetical protein M2650_08495 [Luteimonas sp. SX5]|uniref:Uncharacterized protein n=1 Tax=Luteimonas galliterrae TaxID=2940486 RepID=A0ABT0MIG1_9GAMM|nr:hypothetical protein [Luteimonas galliterrae]MCL1634666.1 hypothetical protein [Luteimonas galliterrae]